MSPPAAGPCLAPPDKETSPFAVEKKKKKFQNRSQSVVVVKRSEKKKKKRENKNKAKNIKKMDPSQLPRRSARRSTRILTAEKNPAYTRCADASPSRHTAAHTAASYSRIVEPRGRLSKPAEASPTPPHRPLHTTGPAPLSCCPLPQHIGRRGLPRPSIYTGPYSSTGQAGQRRSGTLRTPCGGTLAVSWCQSCVRRPAHPPEQGNSQSGDLHRHRHRHRHRPSAPRPLFLLCFGTVSRFPLSLSSSSSFSSPIEVDPSDLLY